MKVVVLSSALLVAVLASPVFAEESSREDFQEFCKAMEGRWVGDVTWVADWPGLGKKGEKVTCYFEGTIAEDGHALTGKFYGGNGSGTGLYYFDAGAKRIKWIWVDSGGGLGNGILFKRGSQWVETGSGCIVDGTRTKHTSTLSIADNGNTHTYTGSGTLGEKKTDDRHDVWRRVNGQAGKVKK